MEKNRKEEEFKEMGEVKKPNISNNSKKIVKEIKKDSGQMNKLNVEKIIDKGKKNDKQITFYQKYRFPVGDYFEARKYLNEIDEEYKKCSY
jgi:F0F1-type ATP synthase membrane subunit b/b'